MLIRFVDAVSELAGKLAAWMFFFIGLIVAYEVLMRYAFTPTIWVDEVARVVQIWATFLAAAYVLKHREMVVIEVAFKDHTTVWRRISETFAVLMIIGFSTVAAWYGFDQWLEKTLINDITDSLLGIPKIITLSSIWVGFGLLLLQCLVELFRIWTVGVPAPENDPLHGTS